ncbi:cupin domain-containing protein [Clostridiaceae bacterium 35-E11]
MENKKYKYTMEISEGIDFRGVGGLVKRLIHPTTTGSEQLGMGIVYLCPGEELPPHKHFNEEAYFILEGSGIMRIEGCEEEIVLKKNLSVYMPAEKEHYTKNTGNEMLVFICALAPPPVAK